MHTGIVLAKTCYFHSLVQLQDLIKGMCVNFPVGLLCLLKVIAKLKKRDEGVKDGALSSLEEGKQQPHNNVQSKDAKVYTCECIQMILLASLPQAAALQMFSDYNFHHL